MPLRSVPPASVKRWLALLAGAIIAALLAAWYWLGSSPDSRTPAAAPAQALASPGAAAPAAPTHATPLVQELVSASGVPIHLKRPVRLSVPPPPYGPAYALLEPAARAGDTVAQYRLGLLLYECRDVPAEAAQLDQAVEHTYETRRRGGWDVDDPAQEEQTLRRRFDECEGVPAQQRGLYRDWLKQAADAGLIEAQLDLPLHLPQGEYCQYMAECSPQQAAVQEALQREAVDYLGRARDAGSANALWTFAAWYAEGDVLPQNNVEAYANFSALDQVFAAAGEPTRFAMMLEDLRGHMRPIDLDQADARMREILSNPNCCTLQP